MSLLLLIVGVLQVFGSAAVAALSLGALAGAFSPRLDLLTHFTPIYLALGVVGLATSFLAPRRVRGTSIGLAVLTVLACGALMVPEYAARLADRAPTNAADQLKVLQFNAYGGYGQDRSAAADWIVAQNPDVIVLEEAGGLDVPVAAKGGYYVNFGSTAAMILGRSKAVSNNAPDWGIISALPPEKRFYALVSRASFRDRHGSYTVMGVHRPWPMHTAQTAAHAAELRQLLATYGASTAIVAGDFNSTPWSYDLRRLDRSLPVTRRTRAVFSWPAALISHNKIPTPIPLLPIDQVYAGSAWKTVKVERGPNLGSDHYPVVVTLARVAAPATR